MPYLVEGRKKELLTEPQRAITDGDFNYLFTLAYIKVFLANPGYTTLARIRKASLMPLRLEEVEAVENLLIVNGVSVMDRIVARDLAFTEFYSRIGRNYEENCIAINGDITQYHDAEKAIIEKFKEKANG